jgi:hypothetical protein
MLLTILTLAPLFSLVALPALADPTSERSAFSTYREEAGNLTVFADGYPASMSGNAKYIPITVAIAMTKSGKGVVFNPESFTLIDASGHAYPAAGYDEMLRGYDKLSYDRSLVQTRPIEVGSYVADMRELEARFYPPVNGGTRTPSVELAPFSWFNAILYFPRPPAGLDGVLTLKVATAETASIDVRFEVAQQATRKR